MRKELLPCHSERGDEGYVVCCRRYVGRPHLPPATYHLPFLMVLGLIAITLLAFGFTPAWAQQELVSQLKDKVSVAGVFFRADAPRVLRNSGDPSLPLHLEIINGIERPPTPQAPACRNT